MLLKDLLKLLGEYKTINFDNVDVKGLSYNSLTTNANDNSDVITKRAKEFMKSGQLQRDIINLILDVTNQRKEFNKIKDEDKNSWDKFVKACSNLPMFKNQENKPVEQQEEEQEEDAWVNDKLNYLRSKGII